MTVTNQAFWARFDPHVSFGLPRRFPCRTNGRFLTTIERLLCRRLRQVSVKTLGISLAADRIDGFSNSEHYIGYIPINLYTEAVLGGVEMRIVKGGLVVQGMQGM